MKTQGRWTTKIGWFFTFVFAILVVGCGGGGSDSATAANVSSISANAGDIIGIRVGQTAILDGSASSITSTSTSPVSYSWSFTSKPFGSTAVLQNPTTVNPSFILDVQGSYMVQLIVSAGGLSSKRAIALVEATVNGNYAGDKRIHVGYPSKCADCHDGRYLIEPTPPKSGNHIATSNMCEACHTTFGFKLPRYTDHKEVFGNCSRCHDGVLAVGKSQFHITTTGECNDCHNTTSFLALDVNGKYDHTGITSGCVKCHNGKTAQGINHNPDTFDKSNTDCVFCHNTTTFEGAYPNHSNYKTDGTRCDSCHGSTAQGVKAGHPDITPVDCGECHSVKQFSLGGVYNHRTDAAVLRCDSCHTDNNTINAIGMGSYLPGHIDPSGEDCGTCHGVGGGSFMNATINHSLASVKAQRCDNCHGVAGPALGKSTNHIITQITPTLVDCIACHTPGNFTAGTFDHSATNTGTLICSDCHNNTNSAGKGSTHIPTSLSCDSCHTADTPATPSTFKGTLYHSGNSPTSCTSCHDGVIQKGKGSTHLYTIRDCSNCHTTVTPLTFTGATYDHGDSGVSTNCASCHDGVTAIYKSAKVDHIPAQKECSECHTNTTVPGGFATSIFKTNVHPNQLNGCEGCHTAKYLSARTDLLKTGSVKHVPSIQDCHLCHSNISFTDITQFTHAGITGNCESCHDGTFYTTGAGPKAKGKAIPAPIKVTTHITTISDCGSCHAIGKGFTDGKFDHTGIVNGCSTCHDGSGATGPIKNSGHVVTSQDCSICHVPGTFKTAVFNHNQIVSDCISCHENPGATATVKPNPDHVATTKDCYECHNKDTFAGAKYDHTGITNNCTSCHDGVIARGKDGTHIPTGDDCSACHQTSGMIPATFDHAGINSNCVSCHDGVFATGKTQGHVVTSLDCGSCHSVPKTVIIANGPTNGFIPATHVAVSANTRCDSCHGVTATGKTAKTNPDHWLTSFDCRDCHTTAGFKPAKWIHDGNSTGNCESCHSPAGGARDKTTTPGGHLTTTSQCDECHTTTAWSPTNFNHDRNKLSQDGYPGDHRAPLSCVACHGNSIGPITYSFPQYVLQLQTNEINPNPYCAACHANDFESTGDHNGGNNGTVSQNQNCASGGCHRVNDGGF